MPRKGPERSATLFQVGKRCIGNDKNIWEIIQTKNGVQRWSIHERDPDAQTLKRYENAGCYTNFESYRKRKEKRKRTTTKSKRKRPTSKRKRRKRPTSKRKRTTKRKRVTKKKPIKESEFNEFNVPLNKTLQGKIYITHDNGGRPYLVEHNGRNVRIFKKSKEFRDLDWDDQEKLTKGMRSQKVLYSELIKEYKNVKKFFSGRDYSGYGMHGNSVLFELPKNRYVHVGVSIYEFTTDGPVVAFHSYMGNNDVPYPVTLTDDYAYFMLDTVYVPRDEFPKGINWNDAYAAFYGHMYWPEDKNKKKKTKYYVPPKEPNLTKKKFKKLKKIHTRDYRL